MRLLAIFGLIAYTIVGVISQAVTTIVDSGEDTSVSGGVVWNGNWTTVKDSVIRGVNTSYWGGSTRTTVTTGDSVEIVFKGHTISYYGDIDVDNAQFIVDFDGVRETRTARHQEGFQSQVLLFWKTQLEDAEHRLFIIHNDTAGTWLTVDKFEYVTGSWFSLTMSENITSSTTSSSSSLSSSSIASSSSATFIDSNSDIISSPSQGDDGTPQAVIIGAVIGGMTGAMALFVICFFCLRKRKERKDEEEYNEKKVIQSKLDSTPTLTPWEYSASRRNTAGTGTGGSSTQRASDTLNGRDSMATVGNGKGGKAAFIMSTYGPAPFASSPLARNASGGSAATHPVEIDLGLSAVPEDSVQGDKESADPHLIAAQQHARSTKDEDSSDNDDQEEARPWPFSGNPTNGGSKHSSSQYKTTGESPRTSKSHSSAEGIINAFPMPASMSGRQGGTSPAPGPKPRKYPNSFFSR